MKLALLQERQNGLYRFHGTCVHLSEEEASAGQLAMVEQNLSLLAEAGGAGADIALTSEAINFPGKPAWLGGTDMAQRIIAKTQDRIQEEIAALARSYCMDIVAGLLRVEDGAVMNEAAIFGRDGRRVGCYRKQIPAGDEAEWMVPGSSGLIWESGFGKIGLAICWDAQFPELIRTYARAGAQMLLVPTWGWERSYGRSVAQASGMFAAAAMAVAEDAPIDGVRRSPSQLVAPDGSVLAEAGLCGPELLLCEVPQLGEADARRDARLADLAGWERRFSGMKECGQPSGYNGQVG